MREVHATVKFVIKQNEDGAPAMEDTLNIIDMIKNEGVEILSVKAKSVLIFEINRGN